MDSNNTFRGSTPLAKARIPPRSIKRHYNEFQFDKQSESAKKKAKKKKTPQSVIMLQQNSLVIPDHTIVDSPSITKD